MEGARIVERVDKDILRDLLTLGPEIKYKDGTNIKPETLTQLINYSKKIKKGWIYVDYKKASFNFGRRYSQIPGSIQYMKSDLRHTLTHKIYDDIDTVNAQPVILSQLLKKNNILSPILDKYINEREKILEEIQQGLECPRSVSKDLIISLIYGSSLQSFIIGKGYNLESFKEKEIYKFINDFIEEIKDNSKLLYTKDPYKMVDVLKKSRDPHRDIYKNPISSFLSILCQDIEDKILMCLKNSLEEKGFKIGVLVYDGLMVEKDPENLLNDFILKEIQETIKNKLSYDIELKIKPMDKIINTKELLEITGKQEIKDADEASDMFLKYHGINKFKYCDKELYIFDDTTGMWNNDPVIIRKMALKHKNILNKFCFTGFNEMMECLKTKTEDPSWIIRTEMSSVGYLLFNNGYYNMTEGKFYNNKDYSYNPDIVFYKKINRDFLYDDETKKEENEKNIKMVLDEIFYKIMDKEEADYLILCLSRSLYGPQLKRVYFGIGAEGNNGKSLLTALLSHSLDGYFHSYNAGNFVHKPGITTDEGARLRWSYIIRHCRIIVSNEIRIAHNENMSGDELKKHSGGDTLEGRKHREEERNYNFQYTPYIMSNDIPNIVPYDTAINSRIRVFNFPFVFKVRNPLKDISGNFILDENGEQIKEPLKSNEKEAIEELKFNITKTEYKDGFLYLLLKYYKEFNEGTRPFLEPEHLIKNKEEWIKDDNTIKGILLKKYDITDKEEDHELTENLINYIKKIVPMSNNKIGRELNKILKFKSENKYIEGGTYNIRPGIKKRLDYDKAKEKTLSEDKKPSGLDIDLSNEEPNITLEIEI
jgi:phage/plasmid-associated DNA primase